MSTKPKRMRRALVTGAVVAGAGLGTAGIASAATTSTTTAPASGSSTTTAPAGGSATAPASGAAPTMPAGPPGMRAGPPGNPATMTHGPNETLLTGTDLQEATAAATAAVPGATVIRAETDSSGASPYEVHMKKADGTYVTVELNSSFGAITTVSGFGAGPAGGHGPGGAPSSSTPTN